MAGTAERYDNLESDAELDFPWSEIHQCQDCKEDVEGTNGEYCKRCEEWICESCWREHDEKCLKIL